MIRKSRQPAWSPGCAWERPALEALPPTNRQGEAEPREYRVQRLRLGTRISKLALGNLQFAICNFSCLLFISILLVSTPGCHRKSPPEIISICHVTSFRVAGT